MKAARRNDVWRRATKRAHPLLSGAIEISFPWSAQNVSLDVKGSVAVVAGSNASGKSQMLQGLANKFSGQGVTLVRLHELCEWLRLLLKTRADFIESISEYEPVVLAEDDLASLSSVVGRRYDAASWFNLEFDESPFTEIVGTSTFPYMVVEHDGHDYGSQDMGLGELGVHVLFWVLRNMQNSEQIIVLLDEPDAFLPDASSEMLAAYVLQWAQKQQAAVVFTTHCHELAAVAANFESLHILGRRPAAAYCVSGAAARSKLVSTYAGGTREPAVDIFCEDEAAFYLGREVWRALGDLPQSRWTWVDGTGSLDQLRGLLPRSPHLLFAYDADQTARLAASTDKRILLLPGGPNPDAIFRSLAVEATAELATALGISLEQLLIRLDALEGESDDHEWTAGVVELGASRVGSLEAIARLAVRLMDDAQLEAFGQQVASALKPK